MIKTINLLIVSALIITFTTSCGYRNDAGESFFLGTYVGTITCVLTIAGTDVPIQDLPYGLEITNNEDGVGVMNVNDNGILDPFEVTIDGTTTYEGSETQNLGDIEIDGNTLNNLVVSMTVNGLLVNDRLTQTVIANGTSNNETVTLTCTSILNRI